MTNIQGILDEFASAHECVLHITEAMMKSPPTVQWELKPVLDEALSIAHDCAKELAARMEGYC
jgi:DNA-binding transcriptional ArsR family regulator